MYRREGSVFVFDQDGEEIFRTDEVAVGYLDDGTGISLCRHGPVPAVEAWAVVIRSRIGTAGAKDLAYEHVAGEVKIVASKTWDPTDLNDFVSREGRLARFLTDHGLRQVP